MHRSALVLSLSCLTIAGAAACSSASSTGSGLPGSGNAPGTAGASTGAAGASAGTSGTFAGGAGGTMGAAAGAGGAATSGAAGAAGASPAGGSGGVTAAGGAGGALGSAGSSAAGAAGMSAAAGAGSSGASGLAPAVPDGRGIYGHPDPATTYPTYTGFKPWLVEEFNSPIDLDHDPFWTWGDGALFDGQTHMVEKNITFANGHMVLAITKEPVAGGYSFSAADNVADKPVSAAEFRSIYNEFRYGRYEVRMKSPAGASNNFLHTMFAYRAPAYLMWREIDIELTAAPQTDFISNIIVAPPGTRVWSASIEDSTRTYPYGGNGGSGLPQGFNTSSDFHTYAFEWLPTSIKWFVDGTMVREKLDGQGKNNLVIPKESTKIIMNMWVFGNQNLGGGNPAGNVYPIYGEYDWFRFYRWDGDTTYPCADQARSCVTADDLKWSKNNPKDPLPDIRPPMCTGADGMLDVACGP
jgi:endo-1,3-1,4-beta-glycanase ExoK